MILCGEVPEARVVQELTEVRQIEGHVVVGLVCEGHRLAFVVQELGVL